MSEEEANKENGENIYQTTERDQNPAIIAPNTEDAGGDKLN